ncbi:phosphatase PAP2 family protein [Paenibacillus sp. CCS19]|uniref:phosphatase PAP2 family protein n=1 Tax=Paenibacillus sp. CCS19 TaxID=3158387 RepID=UPI00256599DD|nr:phosphatase PAP2 family protein [Paenibacillus cellulosilyticus]GMK37404.1 phosphatase PAP2 family protein [Paenibacillus cellulosilyticus]
MNTALIRTFTYALMLIGIFAMIAFLINHQQITAFDERITTMVLRLYSPTTTAIMKAFTFAGSTLCVTAIALLVTLMLSMIGYRRELIFFAGVIIGAGILNLVLKSIFHRARPDIHRIVEASGYSFPSGHSMAAITLYGITIYFLWKHARKAWLRVVIIILGAAMIVTIGISRIYLGVHYPSDVAGGYVMGAAWLAASIGTYERFLEQRWRSRKFSRI